MAKPKPSRPSGEGIRRWAATTSACLAMMRAGLRARDPSASDEAIARALRRRLKVQSDRVLAAWRRNG